MKFQSLFIFVFICFFVRIDGATKCAQYDSVAIQLKWLHGAQFAGFILGNTYK